MKGLVLALLMLGFGLGFGIESRADAPANLAPPADVLTIQPGERIELTLQPGRPAQEVSRGAIPADVVPPLLMDNNTEKLQALPLAGAPPKPGVIVASMWSDAATGTRLRIDNGYGFPVIYRAFLVFERDGQRVYRPTSICPVLPGRVGVESWGDHVVGLALTGFEVVGPDNMTCNDGSLLSQSPKTGPEAEAYICTGGDRPKQIAPVTVAVRAGADGSIREVRARWALATGDFLHSPGVFFDYPLMGRIPVQYPVGLSVFAMAGLNPPPTAKTADIVLKLNGVEKARKPWQGFAKSMASPPQSDDPTKRPAFFFGMIPFYPGKDASEAGLAEVLRAVGQPGQLVEVQIVGGDGVVIADATYAVDQPLVRTQSVLDPALDEALAKAKAPTQCQKATQ